MLPSTVLAPGPKRKREKGRLLLLQYTDSQGFRDTHVRFPKQICKDGGWAAGILTLQNYYVSNATDVSRSQERKRLAASPENQFPP